MKTYATRVEMLADLPAFSEGAEIGVQRGDFAAQYMRGGVVITHLIDAWRVIPGQELDPAHISEGGQEENYRHVMERFEREIANGSVVVHRKTSLEAIGDFRPRSLDWVYLDAMHGRRDVLDDLLAWERKILIDGCIMGHDFVDNEASRKMGFGVVEAVNIFCSERPWKLVAVTAEEWPSFKLMRV